jgi:hypothetical protein
MSLETGDKLGPYVILAPLGAESLNHPNIATIYGSRNRTASGRWRWNWSPTNVSKPRTRVRLLSATPSRSPRRSNPRTKRSVHRDWKLAYIMVEIGNTFEAGAAQTLFDIPISRR